MQDLNDKLTGGTLAASEWNQVPSEIQNVIESLGITLSVGDLNQLGKAIAGYVANGTFYSDSGSADAYVLSVIGSKQAPPSYSDGFHASFIAAAANTGGVATVNIAGIGAKNITNSGGRVLDGSEIFAGQLIRLVFSLSGDRFEIIDPAATHVTDMLALVSIPANQRKKAVMSGFFVVAPQSSLQGSGEFIWQSGLNKNLANGGTIIDPDNIGGFDGTISTRDAFLSAQGGGVGSGCWVRVFSGRFNVQWFGAVADLTSDDSSSINAATLALGADGGSVYFPKGKYRVAVSLDASPVNDVIYVGDGVGVSQLRSTVAGAPTVLAGDHDTTDTRTFSFHDLSMQYDGASPPVSGTIAIHGKNLVSPSFIQNFSIQKFYDSLLLEATSLQGNIIVSDFVLGNIESKGIHLKGGVQGVWLSDGKISARDDGGDPVSTSVGIQVDYANGVYIKTVDSLLNGRGMLITPSTSETVHWLFADQLIMDTNLGAGLDINPQGGTVRGLNFSNSWSSSNGDIGVKIRGSVASKVDGVSFVGLTALNNWLQGVRLLGGPGTFQNIKLQSSEILSNNQSNTSLPGVQIDGGVSNFNVQNNIIGSSELFTNNQTYAVRVFPGASDNYMINGNNCVGNVTGAVLDGGTGIVKLVADNIG